MRYEIRELDLGGILDQAINLTKNHFALFLKITLILFLPFTLIGGLIVVWIAPTLVNAATPEMIKQNPLAAIPVAPLIGLAIISIINGLVIVPLSDAAIIHAVSNTYLGKPVSIGNAFRRALGIFFPLIGTSILVGLAVGVGLMLCLVPGVIFWFLFRLVTQIIVIEGKSGIAAMKRSYDLMKGNIGIAFVLGMVVFAIGFGIGIVPNMIPQAEIRVVVGAVMESGLVIFSAAVWVVFYFSCRCKAENFDLTILAEAVGIEDAPPPSN